MTNPFLSVDLVFRSSTGIPITGTIRTVTNTIITASPVTATDTTAIKATDTTAIKATDTTAIKDTATAIKDMATANKDTATAINLRLLQLQRRLARAGYYHGAIDGTMGPETRRAIRAFERSYGALGMR
jgi:peptidoglycan hydrolase-like protein with peptidoglycan-binding domain